MACELHLYVLRALAISIMPFFALGIKSSIPMLVLSLVENFKPRYLYLPYTSISLPLRNQCSFAERWPPFLNTITLLLSILTLSPNLEDDS